VDAVVKNDRVHPTSSDRSLQLKRAVGDKLSIATSPNVAMVESPAAVPRAANFTKGACTRSAVRFADVQ
jgi:hypothetical protein